MNKEEIVTLKKIVKLMLEHKKMFSITLPIVLILSSVYIYNVPRYYISEASLAPEAETSSMGEGIGAIASSLGFNINDIQTNDAITPLLYPDLMEDNKFVTDMFKIRVKTEDNLVQTDYYTYLTKYRKHSWLEASLESLSNLFPKASVRHSSHAFNPYYLSREDDKIAQQIRDDVTIEIDKQTGVINVKATAQDPLVCKILADSITAKLQRFIIKYRTNKAQKDVDHYKHLMEEAQKSYELVRRKYGAMADANTDVVLESVRSELDDLENDMQLKYNQYTAYNTQYQASIAKLREKTPVFTLLKGASVPVKPAGPKRILTIAGCLLLAIFAIMAGILSQFLLRELRKA